MGRRALQKMDPKEARRAVARHFQRLMVDSEINLSQFEAQLKERDMVRLLVGFAENVDLPASLRRDCALDVIKIARGPIAPWYHDGATVEVHAVGNSGMTVGEEIKIIGRVADLHQELDDLVARGVPPEQWPEEVRRIAGDMVTAFAGEENS